MNAVLQSLFFSHEFRKMVIQFYDKNKKKILQNFQEENKHPFCFLEQLYIALDKL